MTKQSSYSKMPLIIAVLVLISISLAFAAKSTAAEQELNKPPKGFVALFNGKDLTGWKGLVGDPRSRREMSPEKLAEEQARADADMRKHWKVEDSVLVFDGTFLN